MLTLTQIGLGLSAASLIGSTTHAIVGAVIFNLGMIAATLHLGKPLKAWRFFLGLKTSWLSREILAFSLLAPIPALLAALPFLPDFPFKDLITTATKLSLIPVSLGAIFTSVMIYHDTKRVTWHLSHTLPAFFATFALAATLFIHPALFLLCALAALAHEGRSLLPARQKEWSPHQHSALLRLRPLAKITRARFLTGLLAIVFSFINPWLALPVLLASELLSRHLYFRAVFAPKMPGGLTSPSNH